MSLEIIDIHIDEYRDAAARKDRDYRRFLNKGLYLYRLRESIAHRLNVGFPLLPESSLASNFWCSLLERYETISDELANVKPDLEKAIRTAFLGVPYEGTAEGSERPG